MSLTNRGGRQSWRKLVDVALLAPILVALGHVVGEFSRHAGHPSAMVRPAFLIMIVTIACALLMTAALRNARGGAFLTIIALLWTVGSSWLGLVLLAALAWVAWGRWMRIRRLHAPDFRSGHMLALAAIFLGSGVLAAIASGAIHWRDFEGRTGQAQVAAATELPNIYVILLDGYARADTLLNEWGYENSAFLDTLRGADFEVYDNSRTDHASTDLTLLDILSGDTSGLPRIAEENGAYRESRRRAASAPALLELRRAGYELVTIPSPVVHVALAGWDRALDTGQLTDFEVNMLHASPLFPILHGWVMDQLRSRVLESLDVMDSMVDPSAQRVVLAHILAPHPPFMWDASGRELGWNCGECGLFDWTDDPAEFGELFVAQTRYVNGLVQPHIQRIVNRDPEAFVVILSDHGARFAPGHPEYFRTLFAVRAPGSTETFGSNPRPTDLLMRLLDVATEASPPR